MSKLEVLVTSVIDIIRSQEPTLLSWFLTSRVLLCYELHSFKICVAYGQICLDHMCRKVFAETRCILRPLSGHSILLLSTLVLENWFVRNSVMCCICFLDITPVGRLTSPRHFSFSNCLFVKSSMLYIASFSSPT